jgi:ankyrin repeat protein
MTPQKILIYNIRQNDLKEVQKLVNEKDDQNIDKEMALEEATEEGFFEIVKYLVKTCKVNLHAKNERALERAALFGRYKISKYLLFLGASVTETALLNAIQNNHLNMIQLLIEWGGKIQNCGNEALKLAAKNPSDTFLYLSNLGLNVCNKNVNDVLFDAIDYNRIDTVKFLLENGANPKSINQEKITRLHKFRISKAMCEMNREAPKKLEIVTIELTNYLSFSLSQIIVEYFSK